MFKNIEPLDKKKSKSLKFDTILPNQIGKSIGVLPLGFQEIIEMAKYAPVIIMGNEDTLEFVTFTGISEEISLFCNEDVYIPMFLQTYPFLNVVIKEKDGNLKSVIGVDKSESVGTKKENLIFSKDGSLSPLAKEKIEIVLKLNRQRDISKQIVKELQANDLLVEKDFVINMDGKEKTIINKFYIINREKMVQLSDSVLALWAKKGWITIIDIHLKSLSNFKKVVVATK